MNLCLRDNLYWCDCGGRAVFLDVNADRYFCLGDKANSAFLRLSNNQLPQDDEEHLAVLIARGLLINAQGVTSFRTPTVAPPTRDFYSDVQYRRAPTVFVRALWFELCAIWLLRTKRFSEVIAYASQRRAFDRPLPVLKQLRIIRAIISGSNSVATFTGSHDRCLVRGLAVLLACRATGIQAKLVFGVVAHPFAAHCWVQLESSVLVGGFEQARQFTPILVVE